MKRHKICNANNGPAIFVMCFAVVAVVGMILKDGPDIYSSSNVFHYASNADNSAALPENDSNSDSNVGSMFKYLLSVSDNFHSTSDAAPSEDKPLDQLATDTMEECIMNGKFETDPDPTSYWYNVQSDMSVTDTYSSEEGSHSLLASERTNPRLGGVWQNIQSHCLVANAWYEVRANVLLRDSHTQETVDCDPTIPWYSNEQSCPSVAVYHNDHAYDVAYTVGPLSSSSSTGWHEIYGVFRPTQEMLQDKVQVLVAHAPTDMDIVVNSISIHPATSATI
eukprot:7909456-Ditylum_brightwellii.AAC.1